MKAVALVAQKGGAGKTTIATELAVAAVRAGYRTAVFDLDPQASAGVWGDDRGGEPPQVLGVQAPRLGTFLDSARAQGAELVFLDTAPHADSIAVAAARAADLVLIPCKPSPRDAKAIRASLAAVSGLAGKPCWVVLNEARPGTAMVRLTARALEEAGVAVCPYRLGARVAFVHALTEGRAASEWEPEGAAAAEVLALWRWLCRRLGMPSKAPAAAAGGRRAGAAGDT